MSPERWCKNLTEFKDLLAYVVLYAPTRFPARDQLTLESAFAELEHGLEVSKAALREEVYDECRQLLTAALQSYLEGNRVKGAHLLQQLDQKL
jgi:hypothetical protein